VSGANVMNLTDTTLTLQTKLALSKGLSFIHTPQWPSWGLSIRKSFHFFARNLRLKLLAHYGLLGPKKDPLPTLRVKNPKFDPVNVIQYKDIPEMQNVEKYILLTRKVMRRHYQYYNHQRASLMQANLNYSVTEKKTIQDLMDSDVLVKRADKSATTIMVTKEDYSTMMFEHVADTTTYKTITEEKIRIMIEINRKKDIAIDQLERK